MKDLLIFVTITALIMGFVLFLAGLPGSDTSFYENDTIVCKKWSTEWQLRSYPNRKCWQLKEIKYETN